VVPGLYHKRSGSPVNVVVGGRQERRLLDVQDLEGRRSRPDALCEEGQCRGLPGVVLDAADDFGETGDRYVAGQVEETEGDLSQPSWSVDGNPGAGELIISMTCWLTTV
jgi:hypothetical protein